MYTMPMVARLVLVALLCNAVFSFNLDTETVVTYRGSSSAEFGASLTFHQTGGDGMILVGAPRDTYSNPAWRAGGSITRTGVLYRCPWSTTLLANGTCQQLQVDTTPESTVPINVTEMKTDMRLGSSVLSTGPNSTVLVCATHYSALIPCNPDGRGKEGALGVCLGNDPASTRMRDTVGKCVVLPPSLQLTGAPNDFSPIRSENPATPQREEYFNSLSLSSNLFASVGFVGFATSILGHSVSGYQQSTTDRFPLSHVTIGGPALIFNRGYSWSVTMNASGIQSQNQMNLLNGTTVDTNTAYSVVSGDWDGNGVIELATARPIFYTKESFGVVYILRTPNTTPSPTDSNPGQSVYFALESNEFGEYFGYAMVAVDTDNDGAEELLVGAPHYASPIAEGNTHYDFGRVYYYSDVLKTMLIDNPTPDFPVNRLASTRQFDMVLTGQAASRFGTALASIGDVDRDGYQDVAIGAPGEIINGQPSGAVYIHLGSSTGLSQTPSQRIVSSQSTTRGFGYSLSYGWDIDGNGYSDVAVGAPHASEAFIFRSRPAIVLSLQISGTTEIDATQRNCFYDGVENARACFTVAVCARYTRPTTPVTAVVRYTLSAGAEFFELATGQTGVFQVTATAADTDFCANHTVYVKTSIDNHCQSSNVSIMTRALVDRPSTPKDLSPVLTRDHPTFVPIKHQVRLTPDCPTCRPDLVTNFTLTATDSNVISGVRSTAALAVDIRNIGNLSACQVSVNLNLFSSHATFLSIDETQWTCGEFGYQSLTCRPAPANRHFGAIGPGHVATITSMVMVARTQFPLNTTSIAASANTSSGNNELVTDNNPSTGAIAIFRRSNLVVTIGDELPSFVTVTNNLLSAATVTSLTDLPLSLVATTELRNTGPSTSTSTDIVINYPIETRSSALLYYLVAIEATSPNISCNSSALLNENGINLNGLPSLNSTQTFYAVTSYAGVPSSSRSTTFKTCDSQTCSVRIQCCVPPQQVNNAVQVRLQWRVYTSNLQSIGLIENTPVSLNVTSKVVTTSPFHGYTAMVSQGSAQGSTEYSVPSTVTATANSNVIIGVVVGCVAFLLLLSLILYACGFFKRKKPEMADTGPGPAASAPPATDLALTGETQP